MTRAAEEPFRIPHSAFRIPIRPDLQGHVEYEPIEPVEILAERLGVAPERIVKLDGNENLYGPTPRLREALAAYNGYHIYPDPDQRAVRAALAEYTGVGAQHIVAGNGSDELIDLVARALLSPGDRVIDLVPSFGMYPFTTSVCGGVYVPVPRRPDFSVDVAAVARAVDERTKIIFAASPNNPTGNRLLEEELERLLALPVAVVVDEAYIEFCGGSYASLVPERSNLIVLRTFSKWAGLAGMRAGYGILPIELARTLMAIKLPYNITVATEIAMLVSLEDRALLMDNVAAIVRERHRLIESLRTVPYLEPLPSETNFVLCRVRHGSAHALRDHLRVRGIFVRTYSTPALEDYVRISVGRPEHTDALLAVLREVEPE
jgi:histidinol-phosphate aminotransferase